MGIYASGKRINMYLVCEPPQIFILISLSVVALPLTKERWVKEKHQ